MIVVPSELTSKIVRYEAPEGAVRLDVSLEGGSVWLRLNQMAELFEQDKSVISWQLRNVFRDGDLERNSVVAFFATIDAASSTNQPRRNG